MYHTKDCQSNRLLKERKPRVPLTTTPYSLPQLQFTNTKARGSHQVSLVPHGPSAPLNGKSIITAAVSSTCTTQKIFSLTDFSKKENHWFPSPPPYSLPQLQFTNTKARGSHQVSLVPHGPSEPINGKIIITAAVSSTCSTQKIFSPTDFSKKETTGSPHHHTILSAPTSVHQHKSTRLTSRFFGASRSVSADQRPKYHHRRCFIDVYHTKDFQSNRLLKERKPRVLLTTTPYSLPQLQFTNTKASGSHQVSLVPHGPSAPINGKSIIIAAVSSTWTTQKTLSLTDFSKKENHGFPSPPHHTLCPNFSSPTQKHAAHIKFLWCLTVRQRRSTPKVSSSPLFHQRVPHKRFSVQQTSQRKKTTGSPHHHTVLSLPQLQFTNTKARGSHQVSLVPHGPSAPINGKSIIIATCTTQKTLSLTDFSKKEKHGFPSPPHRTLCPNFSSPTQKHAAHIKFLWCLTVRRRRSTAKISSSPLFHQRVPHKRPSVKQTSQRKKPRVPLTTTPYSLPQLQFTNTKARGSHQDSLVPHGPSAPINGKSIIIAAVSSTWTTHKIFSPTDFSKKENHQFPSPPHHTLCPNFSSQTPKHPAHIKFLWCLTVRQRRSTAKVSSSPLFHRRVPHKRFSV